MWEGVNCFLDLILSCSNGMLQWYWGLRLIGTVSLKVTPPWEIWKKLIHLKSGTVNFLMVFLFLIATFKEKKRDNSVPIFQLSRVLWKFPSSVFQSVTLWEGLGAWHWEGSAAPSHQQSVFAPAFLLFLTRHSCTFSLDTYQQGAVPKCLDEPELPYAAPGPVGTCWKTLFSRTASAQLFDEFNFSCHGVNSVSGAGRQERMIPVWLLQPTHTGMRDGGKKEVKAESGEDTI